MSFGNLEFVDCDESGSRTGDNGTCVGATNGGSGLSLHGPVYNPTKISGIDESSFSDDLLSNPANRSCCNRERAWRADREHVIGRRE